MNTPRALRFAAALLAVALGVAAPPRVAAGSADVLEQIRALAGVVSVVEAASSVPQTRFFRVEFEQPVDHANPSGPTFRQRLTVLHRDRDFDLLARVSPLSVRAI